MSDFSLATDYQSRLEIETVRDALDATVTRLLDERELECRKERLMRRKIEALEAELKRRVGPTTAASTSAER